MGNIAILVLRLLHLQIYGHRLDRLPDDVRVDRAILLMAQDVLAALLAQNPRRDQIVLLGHLPGINSHGLYPHRRQLERRLALLQRAVRRLLQVVRRLLVVHSRGEAHREVGALGLFVLVGGFLALIAHVALIRPMVRVQDVFLLLEVHFRVKGVILAL